MKLVLPFTLCMALTTALSSVKTPSSPIDFLLKVNRATPGCIVLGYSCIDEQLYSIYKNSITECYEECRGYLYCAYFSFYFREENEAGTCYLFEECQIIYLDKKYMLGAMDYCRNFSQDPKAGM